MWGSSTQSLSEGHGLSRAETTPGIFARRATESRFSGTKERAKQQSDASRLSRDTFYPWPTFAASPNVRQSRFPQENPVKRRNLLTSGASCSI